MATVTHKSFDAQLRGASGILGKLDAQILFFSYEDGSTTPVTSYANLVVLGEAAVADTQTLGVKSSEITSPPSP